MVTGYGSIDSTNAYKLIFHAKLNRRFKIYFRKFGHVWKKDNIHSNDLALYFIQTLFLLNLKS